MLQYNYPVKKNLDISVYSDSQVSNIVQDQLLHLNYFTKNIIEEHLEEGPGKILQINFPNTKGTYFIDEEFSGFRKEEVIEQFCLINDEKIIIIQSNSAAIGAGAVINIVRTLFVSFLLIGSSMLFGIDIYNLAINPIERMIEKVTEVIEKPQKTKEKAFIMQEEEELSLLEKDDIDWNELHLLEGGQKKNMEMETAVIEDAIKKIGILLGIGLGEAGSKLIKNYLGSDGDVDIVMPGNMTMAIFGFCDIRNFTDVTEILEEGVMLFVNRIGSIVHFLTDRHLGTANKNVGDAFLLV